MFQYSSIAIAACFALLAFLPLGWGRLGRLFVWVCLIAGALVGPIAREGVQMAWDWVGVYGALANTPQGAVVYLLLAAAFGELVKAVAPVAAVVFSSADQPAAIAYGGAAGAGFGFMATYQVLGMALGLVGSPFITPLSTTIAILSWFFPVLSHVVTTAFVARAAARGGFGAAFFLVWMVQFALGLSQRLPVLAGVPLGLLVTILASIWLLVVLWRARDRALDAEPASA
jgi:hypothetical protein